jgi:hypothetical protein
MGIKLGDISMLGGAITGKGLFGKGLGAANKVLGPMAGAFPRMAASAQKKDARRAAATAAMQKADFDAKRNAAAGMRARPMVEDVMMVEEAPAGAMMRKGGKVKKMAKGGSTASKRADGCATKGKTKGRFV